MERTLVPTGLFIELPEGYEAQIRPRSGLAIKQGITCLNSPGTIDADYRGEIKIILINLSGEEQVLQPGDRIALVVMFVKAFIGRSKNYSSVPVEVAATYWHFVDLLWLYLLVFFVLIG